LTRKGTIFTIVVISAVAAAVAAVVLRLNTWKPQLTTIQGAVIRGDADTSKEVPISDAVVTATRGTSTVSARSDASGLFQITFPEVIWPGQVVTLTFSHAEYYPLTLPLKMEFRSTASRLIVAAMKATSVPVETPSGKANVVSNLRIRYTVNSQAEDNVGTAVKTFQVVNQGNVPCRHQAPCSPDGLWKAASVSVNMDAGVGNEYRNVRASCIAGPCPFTRIDTHGFEHGGRNIVATAIAWSDTATFLLEAEVFHTAIASNVRQSYPVVFDRSLNFTLPGSQEGVSIEAEINGTPMVFPLGPDTYMDWATCTLRSNRDSDSTVYQCQLKPGYRF
jgi:hypothetical protein